MEANQILLETKLVSEIKGSFFVPSYQRGYRWGRDEVVRLLDDVYMNGSNNYCLQPVVVRKCDKGYELIDGQQRLTTLYILLSYIKKEYKPRIEVKFELSYETRENSAEYLRNINEEKADSNIDFFHIFHAYKEIDEWFNAKEDSVVVADDIYGYLAKYVRVIWYEVGENEDAISLFTRLNIGRIPLTSAELVKAMFLSSKGKEKSKLEKQEEISLQWDNMERELHNDSLWYFLTNRTKTRYQTRIDLVLDLIAEKPEDNREKYYTFFKIDELGKTMPLEDLWRKIQQTFLVLKDWYENHDLYHKIGYLIASEEKTLQDIYTLSAGRTKKEFHALLDDCIQKSIEINGNYADLSYEKPLEYKKISKLLLLFNVESVHKNGEQSEWFPFDRFKYDEKGKVAWSLEHIHAQQSEGLRTQEMWKKWLELHIPSVIAVSGDSNLAAEMEATINKEKIDRDNDFAPLQQKVIDLLSAKGNREYLHSIGNLALLKASDNAALNNSTFDVKRNMIVEMDKEGQYIPFCTKMVFLKYYTPSAEDLHFWGQKDRTAYIKAINDVLAPYGLEPITVLEEA